MEKKIDGKRPAWHAAALAAALLAAGCGGGGAEGEDEADPQPASPAMVASFNTLAPYCGVDAVLPTSSMDVTLDTSLQRTVLRSGVAQQATAAYALNGFRLFDDEPSSLRIDIDDRRGLGTGRYVDRGSYDAGTGMGVLLFPSMPGGGLTCVRGASWLMPVPGSDGLKTLRWSSRSLDTLPMANLPGAPIDGFEWLANYAVPSNSAAWFILRKTAVDAAVVQVCRRTGEATDWRCTRPLVTPRGEDWVFTNEAPEPGVYLLVDTGR